ncbi:betaine-aldehyde dehydrogenase [Rhodococcus sp. ACS1]|uniref:aldehyde dehydrogenase family protein n=1 Tax=Rhodococcus sp. ACS1 TaxID=2028570 RepID=UPI000BB0F0EA|nr:aldehyde dehydrogenase family protein [Rhodococcus sp. ACS1]PBC35635.1 betaine-aldehyde dehydrogenase [Rhodococcus sp. ACS1]
MTTQIQTKFDVPHNTELYIGGRWETSTSTSVVDVVSPYSEEVLCSLPEPSIEDADLAVQCAHTAFDSGPWTSMSLDERIKHVLSLRRAIEARLPDLAQAWALEAAMPLATGTAFGEAALPFIDDAIEVARSVKFTERRATTDGGEVEVRREPVGTMLAILTYNGPLTEFTFTVIPALLVGNPVIVKLPPENRMLGHFLASAVEEAGLPDGLVSILTAGTEVSKHLVAHEGIDLVHFTGGTEIGIDVATVCAQRLARATLELGGKSAAIVADDMPLDEVVPLLLGGMTTYQGQQCVALTRILVSDSRHDELVERLVERLKSLSIGDPLDREVAFGPMPSARIRDRSEAFIERAVKEGAAIATGGRRPEAFNRGFFLEPTLLTNVTETMEVAQTEIFGPVYSVMRYKDIDDAVRITNGTQYGLLSAIYTHDDALAWDVAGRAKVGAFGINGSFPCLTAPYGGVKKSGYGRVAGIEGMLELTNVKQIIIPKGL